MGIRTETKVLQIRLMSLKQANAYVRENHRHNLPTNGHKFSVACYEISEGGGERLCGVAIAGRPIARLHGWHIQRLFDSIWCVFTGRKGNGLQAGYHLHIAKRTRNKLESVRVYE